MWLLYEVEEECYVDLVLRTFLRRMIDLLCGFRRHDHPISLNGEFRKDLQWWIDFVEDLNGPNFFLLPALVMADLHVTLDAAGAIGYGAFYQRQWFNQL